MTKKFNIPANPLKNFTETDKNLGLNANTEPDIEHGTVPPYTTTIGTTDLSLCTTLQHL